MAEKIKVFDLAEELGIRPLDLVKKMQEIGIDVKSHMSSVEDADAEKIKKHLSKKDAPEKEEKTKKTTVKKATAKTASTKTTASKASGVKTGKTTKTSKTASSAKAEKEATVKKTTVKKAAPVKTKKTAPKEEDVQEKPETTEPVKTVKKIIRRKKVEEALAQQEAAKAEEEARQAAIQEEAVKAQAEEKEKTKGTTGEASQESKPQADSDDKVIIKDKAKEGEAPKHQPLVREVSAREMEQEDKGKRADKKVKSSKLSKKDGKLEVVNVYEVKKQASTRAQYGVKKRVAPGREQKKTLITTPKASKRVVKLTSEFITVADLAKEMSVKAAELIQKLFAMGTMATINQPIDKETATLLANEFSYELQYVGFDESHIIVEDEDTEENLVPKTPVVTMMGHVDHGKTSILDAIRKTHVADKEAGGITQHIGAYEVELPKGKITFIDTPGHEAFTEMRARGSQVTDIVILVVAADDGVMPQTKESIDHARAADVEIVVALNKVDKGNANPDMVKKQLAELDLLPEDWGGQTMVIPTVGNQGTGIKELLEAVLLQAEIMELKANPSKPGVGIVVEARLDKGMGPIATVIAQNGTLKLGDYVVAGTSSGRIKSIKSTHGKNMDSILPGRAGEILGLDSVPVAGDKFNCVASESDAKKLVDHRIDEKRKKDTVEDKKAFGLDDMMKEVCAGEMKELKLLVKADTQGSVEALKASLLNLSNETVIVKIIHSGTGGVSTNDVNLAVASGAVIIAFNVRPDSKAQEEAERSKLDIRFYNIIYNCLEDMQKAMVCMLEPVEVEKVNGQAEVMQTFNVSRLGTIAGCIVRSGKVIRNSSVRVVRDGVVVYTGKIKSLKRFKDDAREVVSGLECGMSIDGFNDIKIGDIFESFSVNMVDSSGNTVGGSKKSSSSESSRSA
jgi:translation initiation factor IF-2